MEGIQEITTHVIPQLNEQILQTQTNLESAGDTLDDRKTAISDRYNSMNRDYDSVMNAYNNLSKIEKATYFRITRYP